jgi:protocatechuate 3,4-dioxygenase beta subunit
VTEKAHADLLAEVLARYENSPNPRLREVIEAAIRHLHAFVAEVGLQRGEWLAGIQFLTAASQMCDNTRQEFITLSGTLGVSSLVEMLTYHGSLGTTENSVIGPYFAAGSPRRERGESMVVDPDLGDRVVVRGTITDIDGKPIGGATLDCWQTATTGFYAVQQPATQSPQNLRGIYTTAADGSYEIRTVRPVPYPIPSDGPTGHLLRATGRDKMRAAHIHMWIRAEGFKELITQLFDAETDYLREDAIFGVRDGLIRRFAPDECGELATTFDIVLDRV